MRVLHRDNARVDKHQAKVQNDLAKAAFYRADGNKTHEIYNRREMIRYQE